MLMLGGGVPDTARVTRMTDAIRHRGPDDSGILVEGPVALGFRRLSILDLSPNGHQPMQAAEGQVSVVFNGEIYNYLELRQQLIALGHSFRSSGDTEVLLHAYLQWGKDCVTRFNGMWAFVIHDQRSGTLFGSRDRFGIKPLFRCTTPGAVAFASEIKAILAGGLVRAQPQATTVANYRSTTGSTTATTPSSRASSTCRRRTASSSTMPAAIASGATDRKSVV